MAWNFSLLYNIGNSIFSRISDWWTKRNPQLVISMHVDSQIAIARVSVFSRPIFVRSVRFRFPEKDDADVTVQLDRMIAPHGEADCRMPRQLSNRLVLTVDVAVSATYRTESGREIESDAPIFNLVGGDGHVYKVEPSGRYIGWGNCPKCGELTMFSTSGVHSLGELNKRRKAFERDMKKTHPEHDLSRQKFWQ